MLKKSLLASTMVLAVAGPAGADYLAGKYAFESGSYTTAHREFLASADVDHAVAQYMMGRMYAEGRGVVRDLVQAHMWFNLAALNGYAGAAAAREALADGMSAYQIEWAQEKAKEWRLAHPRGASATAVPSASSATIAEIQSELRRRGYGVSAVTGRLDAETTAAIRAYQADAALPVTGHASESLLSQLKAAGPDGGVSSRDQVKRLQTALNERGYDAGPADGALGPRVRSAIRAYQADAGLPVSGEMSAGLLTELETGTAEVPATPTSDGGHVSAESVSSSQVSAIEHQLLQRDYAVGHADGQIDDQTRIAIRAYQQDAGLVVTGEASQRLLAHLQYSSVRNGRVTANQLVWEIEDELERRGYEVGTVDGTLDRQAVSAIKAYELDANIRVRGDATHELLEALRRNSGEAAALTIRDIESELARHGYDAGVVNGTADHQTYAAIREYQEDAGLPVTGRADADLLRHLRKSDVFRVSTETVAEIESLLDRRGYEAGRIDGTVDAQTTTAIGNYQRDAGLAVTGRPSNDLLAQLRASKDVSDDGEIVRGLTNSILDAIKASD